MENGSRLTWSWMIIGRWTMDYERLSIVRGPWSGLPLKFLTGRQFDALIRAVINADTFIFYNAFTEHGQ